MLFNLVNKTSALEKEDFGIIAMVVKRFVFRIFSPNSQRVFYRPSFSGAAVHELDAKKISEDSFKLLNEFAAQENAYAAMAFLRANDLIVDKSHK